MSNICILDIKVSNLMSVSNSLELVGHNISFIDSWNTEFILPDADIFLLPGVGSFDSGMANLHASGLDQLLHSLNKNHKPIVGICLGMQLLLETSDESRTHQNGLGIVKGNVARIDASQHKVPNIGWYRNQVSTESSAIPTKYLGGDFYFIHSYYCDVDPNLRISEIQISDQCSLTSAYFSSNVLGLQFHPEKSHYDGLTLLSSLSSFFQ